MEHVYVVGHRKPDTDSVTSAIVLANLKKEQGLDAKPYVLGEIAKEAKFVLDYFHIKEPKFLNDVKLQIKDLNYHKGVFQKETASIKEVYEYMETNAITGVPIVNEKQKFLGLITLKGIVRELLKNNESYLKTSYQNILKTLNGEEVLHFDDEIEGNLKIASFKSTTFLENITLTERDILIVGDRHSIIEYAIESGVKLLIVIGSGEIKEHHLKDAKEKCVNIIRTSLETYDTAKQIYLSNYISSLLQEGRITTFEESDYYDEFMVRSGKLKHNNYPILGKNDKCLGLLRVTDINGKNKKKVILVDHNEEDQSVEGLEEAEILEIVDHHKLGDISTAYPINFRNMAVGSTNTILYFMYQEQHIALAREIAGLMLSGILSDTLSLTSPTTTDIDRKVVKTLAENLGINYQEYAREMFKAGTSLEGRSKEEILTSDMKVFPWENEKFAISQIFTLNFEDIEREQEEYIELIEELKSEKEYKLVLVAVTDILKNGSYLYFDRASKEIIEDAFGISDVKEGPYIDGIVSRKKQLVPKILENIR